MIRLPSPLRRLAFLTWYAWRELFQHRSRNTTAALVSSVACATAAAALALAVPDIATAIRLKRLAQSPLARCIWLDDSRDRKFGDARTAELRDRIDRIQDPPVAPYELHGYHLAVLEFAEKESPESYRQAYGRTLAPGDPIYADLDRILRSPHRVEPDGDGIIVSPNYLRKLGWKDGDPPPSTLKIRVGSTGTVVELLLAGISRDPLPLNHVFWIGEAQDRKLRTAVAARPDRIWSGPIPTDWPRDADDYLEECLKILDDRDVVLAVVKKDHDSGGLDWCLELRTRGSSGLGLTDWNNLLVSIREKVERTRPRSDAARFVRTNHDPVPDPTPLPRGDYAYLTVYVTELKDLKPIAAVSIDHADYVNDSSRLLVEEIESTAARTRRILIGLVVAFFVSGVITLLLALNLRARQKTPQIGLLRMMGIGRPAMLGLVLIEAAILWSLGTLLALLPIAVLGAAGIFAWEVTADELRAAFAAGRWPWYSLAFAASYLLVCLTGSAVATRAARRSPPIRSVGQVI